jgi:hypothetical protein
MSKVFTIFVLVALFSSGCATRQPTQAEQNKYDYLNFHCIKSDDNRVAFFIVTRDNKDIDGVTIHPSAILPSAVANNVSKISSRFLNPEPSSYYLKLPKDKIPTYIYQITYGAKDSAKDELSLVAVSFTDSAWLKKEAAAKKYLTAINLNFSCAGDTEKVCSEKLADAVINYAEPFIKSFLAEMGY